jgi:predicted nucleotidyltransferase component of viral defense system
MRISREKLNSEAEKTGFRPEVLEKTAQALHLLNSIDNHPYLKGKFALKGGTALNLFILEVPRLSVDIDLNYIGAADVEAMRKERETVDQALHAVISREDFSINVCPLRINTPAVSGH